MMAMYVACNNVNCVRCREGKCSLDTINLRAADANGQASGFIRCLNFLARTRPLAVVPAQQEELALGAVR